MDIAVDVEDETTYMNGEVEIRIIPSFLLLEVPFHLCASQ